MNECVDLNTIRPPRSSWKVCGYAFNVRGPEDRGRVKLFRFDLKDKSGVIRVTGFNDNALKFGSFVKENQGIILSNFELKPANPQYNNTGHAFEAMLHSNSQIEYNDAASHTPKFSLIASIANCEENTMINVQGVVLSSSELIEFTTKANKEMKKRTIRLADASASIDITLFGDSPTIEPRKVYQIYNCKVGNYDGKSLSNNFSNMTEMGEAFSEYSEMISLFEKGNSQLCLSQARISKEFPIKTLQEVLNDGAPPNGESKNVQFLATISGVMNKGEYPWYISDPTTGKKLPGANDPDCRGFSEIANKEVIGVRKWFTQIIVADGELGTTCTMFDEAGSMLIGCKADEYVQKCMTFPENVECHKFLSQSLIGIRAMFKVSIKIVEGTMDLMQIQINSVILNPDYKLHGEKIVNSIESLTKEHEEAPPLKKIKV